MQVKKVAGSILGSGVHSLHVLATRSKYKCIRLTENSKLSKLSVDDTRQGGHWYVMFPHSVHASWRLPLLGLRVAVQPRYVRTVPDNCGTIFIPGDRWPKRATHILPPCLLETIKAPTPPPFLFFFFFFQSSQIPLSVTQQLEASVSQVSVPMAVYFLSAFERFYESIRTYF